MGIWSQRPPGQRSPFEGIGRNGKILQPAEKVEPAHVQGCGDPRCPICMPKGGRGSGARSGDAMRTVGFDDIARVYLDPNPYGMAFGQPRQENSPAAEERKLRPAIEKYLLKTEHTLAWDDVVGNEAAREALVEAIEHPVKHAALYRHYGRKPTKGVLLYGPPGCGKTMFGKAAASILAQPGGAKAKGRTMLSIKGPEIQSPYVGVTEQTIAAIFAYARAYRALYGHPLVVFIDEADAILPSRDGAGGRRALPYEESQVAAFLAEMDGLEESGAFVILATNRPEAIDAAILRDGRCDRKIKVERPSRAAAEVILARALAGAPIAASAGTAQDLALEGAERVFSTDRVLHHLATDKGPRALRLSDIVNGAMLVGLVEQAKAIAFRRDLAVGGAPSGLTLQDLGSAIDSVLEQNRGLNHAAALLEVAARDGFTQAVPISAASGPSNPPPRYALDEAGEVVRVQ